MDVICERCKAEYEFDEALLGEKGTTVKCSGCGHVFRVLPPSRDLARSHLKLRYAKDGTIRSLSSLRELQQRIRGGEVTVDDELGRDGFPFRPLRDVPELRNFFDAHNEKTERPALEHTMVRPDASRIGGVTTADQTVEARIPGSSAGATIVGRAATAPTDTAPTVHAAQPSLHAREAAKAQAPRRAAASPAAPTTRAAHEEEVRPKAAPSSEQPEPTLPTDTRRRSFTKHTIMGVGSVDLQLPPPPRMPNFGGQQPATPVQPRATASATSQPAVERSVLDRVRAAPSLHATLHGVPPPNLGLHGGPPSSGLPHPTAVKTPAHANASYDRGATLPPLHGLAGEAPSAFDPLHDERPTGRPGTGLISSTDALVARLQANATAPGQELLNAGPRLYLDDDERGPGRIDGSGRKPWLTVILLLALGGAGWLCWRALESSVAGYFEPTAEPEAVEPGPGAVDDASDHEADQTRTTPIGATEVTPANPESDAALSGATSPEPTPATPGSNPASSATAFEAAQPAPIFAPPPTPGEAIAKDASAWVAPAASETRSQGEPAPRSAAVRAAPSKPERQTVTRPSERSVAAPPESYSAWVSEGDQLFARGDRDGAQKAFKAALALRRSGSEANAGLGFALLSAGKTREALPYFDAAANSGYAEANIGLGDAYRTLGQPSTAIEAYQAYLDRLSKGARANYARSQIDRLKSGASGEPKLTPVFVVPPGNDEGYRPAGEFTEQGAPSAPAPANPSESTQ